MTAATFPICSNEFQLIGLLPWFLDDASNRVSVRGDEKKE